MRKSPAVRTASYRSVAMLTGQRNTYQGTGRLARVVASVRERELPAAFQWPRWD
jgi:hypothetical protein